MSIRTLIADDQALVRRGLALILRAERDIEVVGEAADGAEAVAATRSARPDVVLMDVQMPGVDGIEATREIAGDPRLRARVLMLSTFGADEYVYAALRAGASGFLLKNAPPEQLAEGIRVVAAGDSLLAPSLTRRLIEDFARAPQPAGAAEGALASLTDREREVLVLVARGMSNAEIADHLTLGEATVKTHLGRILMKLGLRDRTQAVVVAYESGLVRPG